jgi:hypothetical protein
MKPVGISFFNFFNNRVNRFGMFIECQQTEKIKNTHWCWLKL